MTIFDYEYFMEAALREAQDAFDEGEAPIGAIVVKDNRIIGRGHNRTESLKDATAHAEMMAITSAAGAIGDWRLEGCVLYSTVEPCAMCAGAAVLARIKTIVYGAADLRFGACGTIFNIPVEERLIHRIEIIGGIMEKEAAELMRLFFREVRRKKERVN
jgi:tRNA(adenine34) deaminase